MKVTTVTDLGTEVAYPPHTNHDFAYTYGGSAPHQATQIGDMFLTYDFNGNTKSECRDHADPTCSVNHDHYRQYNWTEDNRLASVIDGGGRSVTRFLYDAAGERLVKYGRGGASITVGQFFNLKGRTAATKHVFAGTTRLASKLLPPGYWPSPTLGAPLTTTVATTSTGATATNPVGDGWPNDTGCVPSDYQPQKCPILVNGEPVVPYEFQDTKVRPATYYYHPDHLGSTSWVTDQNGKVHEHVEYFPYGEVWRDQVSDRDGAGVKGQRFLFSGKELDEETGLYYFGARYDDPVRARWVSADPAAIDLALARAEPGYLASYAYVRWSPAARFDPNGLWDFVIQAEGDLVGATGVEGGVGIVIDFSHGLQSGVFITGGAGGGANVGGGVGVGLYRRDVEGDAFNVDVNAFGGSGVLSWDDKGFNGGTISVGPGKGLSTSVTHTKTFSIQNLIDFVSGLFGGEKPQQPPESSTKRNASPPADSPNPAWRPAPSDAASDRPKPSGPLPESSRPSNDKPPEQSNKRR